MAIKPIITYAPALWFNTTMISSFQIDRLRRFERKWLRHAANFIGIGANTNINAVVYYTTLRKFVELMCQFAKTLFPFFTDVKLIRTRSLVIWLIGIWSANTWQLIQYSEWIKTIHTLIENDLFGLCVCVIFLSVIYYETKITIFHTSCIHKSVKMDLKALVIIK